jgi:hypothetical protein
VASNGITFIPSFFKSGQLVQKLKGPTRAHTHTYTQHVDIISLLFCLMDVYMYACMHVGVYVCIRTCVLSLAVVSDHIFLFSASLSYISPFI